MLVETPKNSRMSETTGIQIGSSRACSAARATITNVSSSRSTMSLVLLSRASTTMAVTFSRIPPSDIDSNAEPSTSSELTRRTASTKTSPSSCSAETTRSSNWSRTSVLELVAPIAAATLSATWWKRNMAGAVSACSMSVMARR
jgi:hypothetical protein